jgi:hypothetical protein
VILDAGFLISVDRGEHQARELLTAARRASTPLRTTHPVVAQVWRSGAGQARLGSFLKSASIHPFDDGRTVGRLLASSGTSDVVDAHLVALGVRLDDSILTGDPRDLETIASSLGAARPTILACP